MDEFRTEGIVIREKLQGEADKMLTILTADKGKVYAYAKGVKKISAKNAPACQLFAFSEYEIVNSNGRNVVKTAIPKDVFFNMRIDPERFALVSYFAEILSFVTMENNDESEVLRLFLNCIYALGNKKEIPLWLIKGAFELKLSCLLGFMPDFSACSHCGCEIELSEINIFNFENSSFICNDCVKEIKKLEGCVPYSCTVCKDVAQALVYICLCDPKKLLSFKLDNSLEKEFSFVCANYLIYKTERNYETIKIYKSIVNSLNTNIKEKNEEQK